MFKTVQMVNGQIIARRTNFLRTTRAKSYGRGRERMFNFVTSVDICALPAELGGETGDVIAFFNTLYDGVFAEQWASRDVLTAFLAKRKVKYNFGREMTESTLEYLFGRDAVNAARVWRVFFVNWRDSGTVETVAILPDDIADFRYNVTCYQHLGGHSAADLSAALKQPLASEADYRPLLREMINHYGYRLRVMDAAEIDELRS